MKKHSRAVLGMAASVTALAAVGFGFSKWNSEATLTGNVTAKGNWDVHIADASVRTISTGTDAAFTTDVVVYPVYAATLSYSGGDVYRMKIDDLNPETKSLSLDDLAEFNRTKDISGVNNIYSFYTSGKRNCTIFFNFNLNELGDSLGFRTNATADVPNTDGGASDGKLIGYAIGALQGTGQNTLKIDLGYDKAVKAIEDKMGYVENTTSVTVYPMYVGKVELSGTEYYRYKIDDANKETLDLTLSDLQAFNASKSIPGQNNVYNFYTSKKANGCTIFYNMKFAPIAYELGFDTEPTTQVEVTDGGASEGEFLGYAIAASKGTGINQWGIELAYDAAVKALEDNPTTAYWPAEISEDALTATYANVEFALPGAWAEYTVTLTNDGTADAYLSDWSITVDGAEGAIAATAPVIPADEVLRPGESCKVTFTAGVPSSWADDLDAQGTLTVKLAHTQQTVEDAPDPVHVH